MDREQGVKEYHGEDTRLRSDSDFSICDILQIHTYTLKVEQMQCMGGCVLAPSRMLAVEY